MAESVARSDEVEGRPSLWAAHWPLIRILIAAGFAFSCFGLLIFVWVSFGGWVPLRAQSYRFTAEVGQTDTLVGPHATNPIPEGGHLADSQVQDQVQIDEIFNALDAPTREAFRLWQQNLAIGAQGRGQDLSDAFGNLGPFAQDA